MRCIRVVPRTPGDVKLTASGSSQSSRDLSRTKPAGSGNDWIATKFRATPTAILSKATKPRTRREFGANFFPHPTHLLVHVTSEGLYVLLTHRCLAHLVLAPLVARLHPDADAYFARCASGAGLETAQSMVVALRCANELSRTSSDSGQARVTLGTARATPTASRSRLFASRIRVRTRQGHAPRAPFLPTRPVTQPLAIAAPAKGHLCAPEEEAGSP